MSKLTIYEESYLNQFVHVIQSADKDHRPEIIEQLQSNLRDVGVCPQCGEDLSGRQCWSCYESTNYD